MAKSDNNPPTSDKDNSVEEKKIDHPSKPMDTEGDTDGFYIMDESEDEYNGRKKIFSIPVNPWQILIKIVFSPVNGWRELKRSNISADKFAQGCYYQMLALMAISVFAMKFYVSNTPIQILLVEAVSQFISFFLGYFLIKLALKNFLPVDCSKGIETNFGNCFILVVMTTLSFVQLLLNSFPVVQPILVFLPLYTIYLIVKGIRFLRVPQKKEGMLIVVISVLAIASPPLLQWIINLMLPVK